MAKFKLFLNDIILLLNVSVVRPPALGIPENVLQARKLPSHKDKHRHFPSIGNNYLFIILTDGSIRGILCVTSSNSVRFFDFTEKTL